MSCIIKRLQANDGGTLEGFILHLSPDKNDFELNSTGRVKSYHFDASTTEARVETELPLGGGSIFDGAICV